MVQLWPLTFLSYDLRFLIVLDTASGRAFELQQLSYHFAALRCEFFSASCRSFRRACGFRHPLFIVAHLALLALDFRFSFSLATLNLFRSGTCHKAMKTRGAINFATEVAQLKTQQHACKCQQAAYL